MTVRGTMVRSKVYNSWCYCLESQHQSKLNKYISGLFHTIHTGYCYRESSVVSKVINAQNLKKKVAGVHLQYKSSFGANEIPSQMEAALMHGWIGFYLES